MILNPGNKVAILLDEWHYWWPWIPVKIDSRNSRGQVTRGWRWLVTVQRKKFFYDSDVLDIPSDTHYRDLIS